MYLDMIITKEGYKLKLDEEELLEALNNGELTEKDIKNAYEIYEYLENKYYNNIDKLKKFTKELINKYSVKE